MRREGTLGQFELAQKDGSGLTQSRNDRRIVRGTIILVNGHTRRGRNALGMKDVLHRDRNAMERATNYVAGDLTVSLRRLSQRHISG
jgi:hypothetical protein